VGAGAGAGAGADAAVPPEPELALTLENAFFDGPPPQFTSKKAKVTTRSSVDKETFMGESFQG
jgi:hypothetical protein